MLKRMNIVNLTQQQKEEEEQMDIEEHHTIYSCGTDKYKYGKLIEEMKNDILRKKDPLLKLSQCHFMYYQNGKITTADNTTITKMNATQWNGGYQAL